MTNSQETKRLIYNRLRRMLDKHIRMEEQPFPLSDSVKLSPREGRTIQFLGQSGTANVTNVATHFRFTKSAASQLVNRLVKRGLIDKVISRHSEKEYQLSLSSQGRKAYHLMGTMDRERLDMFMEFTSSFSKTEITATADVLEALERMMDQRLKQFE